MSSYSTQVTLVNPICLVAYIHASWKFFDDRIHDEEITLIYFFGDDYLDYQKKIPATGVPYVKGFEIEPACGYGKITRKLTPQTCDD